jgi:hypothetical protein
MEPTTRQRPTRTKTPKKPICVEIMNEVGSDYDEDSEKLESQRIKEVEKHFRKGCEEEKRDGEAKAAAKTLR